MIPRFRLIVKHRVTRSLEIVRRRELDRISRIALKPSQDAILGVLTQTR